jgi:cytochrome c oxidase cbb3-type subunit III
MEINDKNSVEKDELTNDKLLAGHDYDGIRELDNNLPKWWLWLFIITAVWGIVYLIVFDVLKVMPHQQDEYKNEMTAAGGATPAQLAIAADTAGLMPLTEQANLDAGKVVWDKSCVPCHLAGGQGLVGPNLCDTFSIHGCGYKDIVNIITVGQPDKGMISWKAQLTRQQILDVASFVLTLRGTTPPNPKAPQGAPCK